MAANEASPFESSDMLATFLASTPLLRDSWSLCHRANSSAHRSFVAERIGAVAYVAFSGVQMVGGSDSTWRSMVPLDRLGDVALFTCLRGNNNGHKGGEEEEPVMVQAAMLTLFSSLFNSFQNQILAMVENTDTKSVVITGHSIGGATASLCTLWLLSYLRSIASSVPVLCITFGSPLLGNKSFSQVILKERWGGNFIHVVSKHDIMPRLLFAPTTPLTSKMNNFLLQFWHLSMTSPDFAKVAVQVTDRDKSELFISVIDCLEAATQEGGDVLFHPFGNYFFVSEDGAICMDGPVTAVKMMHLMLATGSPAVSIEDHLKYGDYVDKVSLQFLIKGNSMQGDIPESNYEAGLELAIQSSGLANQESVIAPVKECLKTGRRIGLSPSQNAATLAISLSKVAPLRAQIEWYKAWCEEQDEQAGYYDSFKSRGSSKRDMRVNINRIKLGKFWDSVVEMLEKNELPQDLGKRAKWIYAPHSYKLLVEPLDIAEYYRKGLHRTKGHYMEHGREKRYEIFDKWVNDRIAKFGEGNNNERSKFASLTQDSCFWAKVEEARDWLDCIRMEKDMNKLGVLWDKIEKFEVYAKRLIEQKEVSKDVLAKNSSYSLWVEDLKEMKQLRPKVGMFPHQFYPIS